LFRHFSFWKGALEELPMIDAEIIAASCSTLNRPPRRSEPGPTDLDRLAASLRHLALCCGSSAADEYRHHAGAEAVAEHEQILVGPVPITCEQLQHLALLGAEGDIITVSRQALPPKRA